MWFCRFCKACEIPSLEFVPQKFGLSAPPLGSVPGEGGVPLGWKLEKGMGPSDRNVLEVQGLTVRFDTSERSVVAVRIWNFMCGPGKSWPSWVNQAPGNPLRHCPSCASLSMAGEPLLRGGSLSPAGRWEARSCQSRRQRHAHYPGRRNLNDFSGAHDLLKPRVFRGGAGGGGGHAPSRLSHAEAEAEALRMLELVRIPEAKQILKRYPHQLPGDAPARHDR